MTHADASSISLESSVPTTVTARASHQQKTEQTVQGRNRQQRTSVMEHPSADDTNSGWPPSTRGSSYAPLMIPPVKPHGTARNRTEESDASQVSAAWRVIKHCAEGGA